MLFQTHSNPYSEGHMAETFMDQDFNDYVSEAQEDEAKTAALLPNGWYRTTPPVQTDVKKLDDGRRMVRFNPFVQDDAGHKGFLGFSVSPDLRPGKDGKPDFPFRLFVAALSAYRKARGITGQVPNSEVLTYLAQYPVELRARQMPARGDFDPSNMVVAIRPVTS